MEIDKWSTASRPFTRVKPTDQWIWIGGFTTGLLVRCPPPQCRRPGRLRIKIPAHVAIDFDQQPRESSKSIQRVIKTKLATITYLCAKKRATRSIFVRYLIIGSRRSCGSITLDLSVIGEFNNNLKQKEEVQKKTTKRLGWDYYFVLTTQVHNSTTPFQLEPKERERFNVLRLTHFLPKGTRWE